MSRKVCCASLLAALFAGCAASPRAVQPIGFQACDTGTEASLRGLAAVDGLVAYVGGSDGALLRTTDGGRTFRDVAPPDAQGCDFRDVEALSRDHVVAMVAGQPARIYCTLDGGASWSIAHEDPRPEAFFDALAFLADGVHGVAFGDAIDGRFTALGTNDGGRSWNVLPAGALPAPREGEAGFAASGTCVAPMPAGPYLFLVVTGGNGSRLIGWTPGLRPAARPLPLDDGAPSRGAFSVAARGHRAVVVGGDYAAPARTQGTAAWTADGGATWRAADAGGYRSGVCWLDDETLLAVGSHGCSVSYDGGCSWLPFGDVGYHGVAVGRDGSVWVCGSGGRVAKLKVAEVAR